MRSEWRVTRAFGAVSLSTDEPCGGLQSTQLMLSLYEYMTESALTSSNVLGRAVYE